MKRIFMRTYKYIFIILFVVISTSYVHIIETKSLSDNVNKNVNLSTMALKVEEFEKNNIYRIKDTYTGDLTGYVYNCPLCNGTLACKSDLNIKDGNIYYEDETYGKVKIVASSSNLSCGTIIRFEQKRISDEPIIAIVLDRGVKGNAIDLLSENLDYAIALGRSSIVYDVLREGW